MGSVRHFRDGSALKKVPIRETLKPLPATGPPPSVEIPDNDKRYHAIFHAAAMGIAQCTMDGHVVESNAALERMLGYTHEELRGMHFREFTHPEDVGSDAALFQEMVKGKRDSYEIELRYIRKDRAARWVRLTVSLVRRTGGTPAFAIGMTEDITERKRAEQQLREAQKMEAIGRMVGGVAHDFNNLLTGIMLYCDLLMSGLEKGSRLCHHAEEIHTASEHGATLIQQLLAVARQQVVEPQVLCLDEIVAEMTNLLARLIGEHIELVTEPAEDLGKVKLDPAQVKQIVMNLVLNARDAMHEGGRITVKTSNRRAQIVTDSGAREIECVSLAVRDAGCGMDAETRARIFEPFFTTKAAGEGNGLGLATVYSIVKQNGGAIEVESEPGRGTQVSIFFPQVKEESKVQEFGQPRAGASAEMVLLVDDNPQVRNSVGRLLSDQGYGVIEAANGAEALSLFESKGSQVDLLLVDLAMPGMSGREVAKRLRKLRPKLKVLFISGYRGPQLREQAGEVPIELFQKPFDGRALAKKVREVLDASATRPD
jgi:two-component system, cell cycle sensor histidine kinase and response regulator CckA